MTEISRKEEFVYLLAILGRTSRSGIAWAVSIILDVVFCLDKGIHLNRPATAYQKAAHVQFMLN